MIFFINKIKNKQNIFDDGNIFIYKSPGITEDNINNVIQQHDLEQERILKILMQEYINKKNLQNNIKLQKFLMRTKQALDKNTFEKFEQKIKEYDENDKN